MDSVNLANPLADVTFAWSASDMSGSRSRPLLPSQSLQSLFDFIRHVQYLQPLSKSRNLQPLALEALNALEIRADEDIETWAVQLAGDVVEAID
ncbi:hypothetical protein IQ235_04150 [Oscillatoriales cyanobacterium LEGE 11467]|uniref:Uncharacterized protein n=1 Tax=Zarconia navalis LEGE 11467 TaxID=1828826 RepID=A0A928Z7R9_9CYAN|nr:hypothetical protein [Zarconia navalis]MBE9039983.1 hypothetical protein [Zarconia navalis LEGE 11467]